MPLHQMPSAVGPASPQCDDCVCCLVTEQRLLFGIKEAQPQQRSLLALRLQAAALRSAVSLN